jgi:hypothetical protein
MAKIAFDMPFRASSGKKVKKLKNNHFEMQ